MPAFPPLGKGGQKRIASLRHAKYRRELGLAFTEGVRSVAAAHAAGVRFREVVVTSSILGDLEGILPLSDLPVHVVSPAEFDRISDVRTGQGILATFETESTPFQPGPGVSRVVVLDGVQDPGNVGTTIRTAAWYGVQAVIAGPGSADFYNPKTVRSTMGALWSVGVHRSDDLNATIDDLNAAGFSTCASTTDGDPATRVDGSVAVILGGEAGGVSPGVLDRSHRRICIPSPEGLPPGVDSLNVSVAAAVILDRLFGVTA